MNVFLLWHMRPLDETETDEVGETNDKLCGAFSSRERAEAAQRQLVKQEGFRDFPDAFLIDEYTVDEVQWQEGFVSLRPGE
jgi:hypothetical protein